MKTLTKITALIAVAIMFSTNLNASSVNFTEESYINDIPFNTTEIYNEIIAEQNLAEFDFEEEADGTDAGKYAWANSAYAMAGNINRAFKHFGWCSRIRGIESGGAVEELPCHTFPTDDGGVDMKCPTEIAISDRREAELAKNGFMPLIHKKNSDFAAFIGAQSLQQPQEYEDPDASANANLAARLPYLFATCRFAHYLKCIVRDKIGSFKERALIVPRPLDFTSIAILAIKSPCSFIDRLIS